jgi:hypothetical protein
MTATELEAISRAWAAVREAQNELAGCVADARRAGASWQDIGTELHMSRQAAWERWHHLAGA